MKESFLTRRPHMGPREQIMRAQHILALVAQRQFISWHGVLVSQNIIDGATAAWYRILPDRLTAAKKTRLTRDLDCQPPPATPPLLS